MSFWIGIFGFWAVIKDLSEIRVHGSFYIQKYITEGYGQELKTNIKTYMNDWLEGMMKNTYVEDFLKIFTNGTLENTTKPLDHDIYHLNATQTLFNYGSAMPQTMYIDNLAKFGGIMGGYLGPTGFSHDYIYDDHAGINKLKKMTQLIWIANTGCMAQGLKWFYCFPRKLMNILDLEK